MCFTFCFFSPTFNCDKKSNFYFFLNTALFRFCSQLFKKIKINKRKYISIFLILFCTGLTIKYHQRFNIERKFHELNNVDFSKSIKAEKISKKFKGLNWITPKIYRNYNMNYEIKLLSYFKKVLKEDTTKKIVITNYSFFSTISNQNMSSFSRWYPGDNSAFPIYGNEFYNDYRKFIIKFLFKKKINTIYILPDVTEQKLTNYVSQKCFNKIELKMRILKYEKKKKCTEFSIYK